MPDPIELDPVEELAAGAVGEPGQRAFYIQARGDSGRLTVLVGGCQILQLGLEGFGFLFGYGRRHALGHRSWFRQHEYDHQHQRP